MISSDKKYPELSFFSPKNVLYSKYEEVIAGYHVMVAYNDGTIEKYLFKFTIHGRWDVIFHSSAYWLNISNG